MRFIYLSPSTLVLISAFLSIRCGDIHVDASSAQFDEEHKICMESSKFMKGLARETSFIEAIRRGQWECARHIVEQSEQLPLVDYKSLIAIEMRSITDQMESLRKGIKDVNPKPSINCPFKWAQSPTEILLSVKFSHKIDAPATLNVVANNVSISSDSLVMLASDGKKNFQLNIDFHGSVLPEESTWSMASVGRMSFNIKKAQSPSKWTALTKDNKKLPQMHSWWEMQEKFEAELEKLVEQESLTSKSSSVPAATTDVEPTKDTTVPVEPVDAELVVDESFTGRIVSPEEALMKTERKKIEDEYKLNLSSLTDEARRQKKEVDLRAKQEKAVIDTETASKVAILEEERNRIQQLKVSDEL